jgi:poly(3-hydroxybutyrate) depolymerase
MLYQLYQTQADLLFPVRQFARFGAELVRQFDLGPWTPPAMRHLAATWSLLADGELSHQRPAFGLDAVTVNGQSVAVTEQVVAATPFGSLLHFRKDSRVTQPRVLLVAPLSGHFSTLLRDTVRVMLPDHDVFITDWRNARDVALAQGRFGMDEYIDHLMHFLREIGAGAHIVAVCQPAVAVLAAVALLAEAGDVAQPRSMTLMAGPIDTRIRPTKVNQFAASRPIDWFERRLIGIVPLRYRGALRRVYPGFVQLTAFMSMNLDRHLGAHLGQMRALVGGDDDRAAAHRRFYGEYRAVMDLPAEFFLETVERVFQRHALPLGQLDWRGVPVRPAAIEHTALLTVEGERDDICALGQTRAAQDLCTSIPSDRRQHHVQPEVGHYGVFSGRRWEQQTYPRLRAMIRAND